MELPLSPAEHSSKKRESFTCWNQGDVVAYWAVAHTHPKQEHRARMHMGWQGFETYAPRERVVKRWHGKRLERARWLFPRYVFVRITDHWHCLFSTFGISRLLLSNDMPAKVPDKWIKGFTDMERGGLITLPKRPRFQAGQRLKVTSGPLAGKLGLYQGATAHQRERVLLDALGKVEIASGDLAAA